MKKGQPKKEVRLRNIKKEIIYYVRLHPGCSAISISAYLISKGFGKNNNVSSKRMGFLIKSQLSDKIVGIKTKVGTDQKKLYYLNKKLKRPLTEEEIKEHTLEFLMAQDDPCSSADIANYLSEVSGFEYTGRNIYRQLLDYPEVIVEKINRHSLYSLKTLEDKIK
jgi:hypothetical protein